MRYLPLLLLAVAVAACTGAQAYTQTDLVQVKQAYHTIKPIYIAFRAAYRRNDWPAMQREFRREQAACRRVDVIDQRDSIDPNTALFQASVALDTFCNDIETAYASWEKAHGHPYDHTIVPSLPSTAFMDGDFDLTKMHGWLRHPAALA